MAGSGATAVRMLTMTLSMKKIVDQEIAVQVKGYPLPQPFSLGGKNWLRCHFIKRQKDSQGLAGALD